MPGNGSGGCRRVKAGHEVGPPASPSSMTRARQDIRFLHRAGRTAACLRKFRRGHARRPGGRRDGHNGPMVQSRWNVDPADLLAFWREAGPQKWFRKDPVFDAAFRTRFLDAHEAAVRGELDDWAREPDGALALLILLDQFPRNAFRGTARMFESDARAMEIAREALRRGFDARTDAGLRNFFYLPFMHSEELADQDLAVELTLALGGEALRHAVIHRDIIERFGRFPHRNPLLGRSTTPEEQRFLDEGGFGG
jgi:uncharacterized protein (DUF924 family)